MYSKHCLQYIYSTVSFHLLIVLQRGDFTECVLLHVFVLFFWLTHKGDAGVGGLVYAISASVLADLAHSIFFHPSFTISITYREAGVLSKEFEGNFPVPARLYTEILATFLTVYLGEVCSLILL